METKTSLLLTDAFTDWNIAENNYYLLQFGVLNFKSLSLIFLIY